MEDHFFLGQKLTNVNLVSTISIFSDLTTYIHLAYIYNYARSRK